MRRSYLGLTVGLIAFGATVTSGADDEVTAEQFLRLLRAQQSAIRDVAFAFEGERRYLGPADEATPKSQPYQGRYALRADGATFFETFWESGDAQAGTHKIQAVVRGQGEMKAEQIEPGVKFFSPVAKVPLGPGSFFRAGSPETFHFLWRFQTLKEASDFGYRFLGWEEVDGHRCAHIEFNAHPRYASRVLQELWIDLERGGHPLRLCNSDGGQTVCLVDKVRLKECTLPSNETVWFPVGGDYGEYYHDGKYTAEPAYLATTYILDGTLFFNQELKDDVFRAEGTTFRPSFQVKPDQAKAGTRQTSRRAGVDVIDAEAKLDAAIAAQSSKSGDTTRAMDAAASLRDEAASRGFVPWAVGGLGVAAVAGAGVIAFRRRS